MDIRNLISINLKKIRKDRKLTQAELATLAKLSVQRIRDIESGRGAPSIQSLSDLAKNLGVKVSELIEGEGEPKLEMSPDVGRVIDIMGSIPEEIYLLSESFDKKNEVWSRVKIVLEVAIEKQQLNAVKKKKA